jgi:anti-anti-sigma factor
MNAFTGIQLVGFGPFLEDAITMDMQIIAISQDTVKVALTGRLDVEGSGIIDLPFNTVVGSNRNILVDLSAVTFVASIAIRTLVLGAKTLERRGKKLLLLNPQPKVEYVLKMIGVTDLLPIVRDENEAVAVFSS